MYFFFTCSNGASTLREGSGVIVRMVSPWTSGLRPPVYRNLPQPMRATTILVHMDAKLYREPVQVRWRFTFYNFIIALMLAGNFRYKPLLYRVFKFVVVVFNLHNTFFNRLFCCPMFLWPWIRPWPWQRHLPRSRRVCWRQQTMWPEMQQYDWWIWMLVLQRLSGELQCSNQTTM
jgi:hypothetical protein